MCIIGEMRAHRNRPRRRDAGRPRGAPVVDEVLRQALLELGEAGFERLSVEKVAARAKVNKTSVYRRWPTREALVAAALERVAVDLGELPDLGSLHAELLALATRVAAMLATPQGRALVRAGISDAAAVEVATLATRSLARGAVTPARQLMERARRRGEWRRGVDSDQVVFVVVGAVMHRVLLEHRAASRKWLVSLVDLVLHGAAREPPRP